MNGEVVKFLCSSDMRNVRNSLELHINVLDRRIEGYSTAIEAGSKHSDLYVRINETLMGAKACAERELSLLKTL